jgi:hypothetical protein
MGKEEADDLVVQLLSMAKNPDAFTKWELGAMVKLASDRIRYDAAMMERVRAEIQLAVKSTEKCQSAGGAGKNRSERACVTMSWTI